MITEGFFRRHVAALGNNREVALLDVAQEYILGHLRTEGWFDDLLVFKGGTALQSLSSAPPDDSRSTWISRFGQMTAQPPTLSSTPSPAWIFTASPCGSNGSAAMQASSR